MKNLIELRKEELREIDGGGWFWGRHCKNGVERYRIFGIGVGRGRGCCPTYN